MKPLLTLFYFLALISGTSFSAYSVSSDTSKIEYTQLAKNVWMHTSYHEVTSWGKVLSNGLIVQTPDGAILIDTGWNNTQTAAILKWSEEALKQPIVAAVFTHAHSDKMGGVDAVIAKGAETFAHPLSNKFAPQEGLTPAEHDLTIQPNGRMKASHPAFKAIEIYYPGGGHTLDNIVVAIPEAHILFGGCLIRPGGSHSLGNTASADLSSWASSIKRTAQKFPDASLIIPSHGAPAGRELLEQTEQLARQVPNTE